MIGQREALRLFGCDVFDPQGHRIGIVGQLFLEETTEQPAWITVQIGLFGTRESFVPLEGAAFDGDTLTVAVTKDAVRNSPWITVDDGNLPAEQEEVLYLYYGVTYGVMPAEGTFDGKSNMDAYVEAVRRKLRCWVITE